MKYSDYLKTPEWDKKRKQVYKQAKYKCRLCNKGDKQLNAHHIHYGDLSRTSVSHDLICLCSECHLELHARIKAGTLLDWPSYRDLNKKATKKQYKKYLRKQFSNLRGKATMSDKVLLGMALVFISDNFTDGKGNFHCGFIEGCPSGDCDYCQVKEDFKEIKNARIH